MSTPTGTPPGFNPWQTTQPQGPPMASQGGENEDGVSVRPMRLKVLYTFDDQNKTNCLARWPHVLQIQTVAMDEATSIGVIELKTCIDAIVQCSPELVARLGQDYTVYAYDYSEYDNPLVGQGMLSRALSTASPTPDAPASQSRQLITGRVCKNIMGLFSGGVKETLEVKLRLVPVPTMLQGEYVNTMEKYRELSKAIPPGFDVNEWNSFLQSNPNLGQMAKKLSPPPTMQPDPRNGMSMEVVNQLLSPHQQQQPTQDPFNQAQSNQVNPNQGTFSQREFTPTNTSINAENSGNESRGNTIAGEKAKKTSRPSSRVSVKRPRTRKPKAIASAQGGNTSGYEEGTDGDDGPAPKKRAKVTKTDWNRNTTLGMTPDSLRVAAGTSGSLRLFRPIAMSPHPASGGPPSNGPPGNHLIEVPRAPTPVPHLPNQHIPRDQAPAQSSLRRDSFVSQYLLPPREHVSPYLPIQKPEDEVRRSIESAHPSPERFSPADTPPDIGSSPPVMRTRPPSVIRSSPPCPSSPVLPQMPRTDSGFMSGSLDDLFGDEDEPMPPADDSLEIVTREDFERQSAPRRARSPIVGSDYNFVIEEEIPGPPELLPTRMPDIGTPKMVESRARAAINLAGSVVSEDGQVLPPLKNSNRGPMRRAMSQPNIKAPQYQPQKSTLGPGSQQMGTPQPDQQFEQHLSMSQPPPEMQYSAHTPHYQPEIQYPAQNEAPQHQPEMLQYNQNEVPQPLPKIHHPAQTFPSKPPTADPIPVSNSAPPAVMNGEPVPESVVMQATEPTPLPAPGPAPRSRPTSRSGMKVRTASMGSLTLPHIPASDPVFPPSSLQRSQTWSEAPHPASEAPMPPVYGMQPMPPGMSFPPPAAIANGVPYSRTLQTKKELMRQKLEEAIAKGQMPPYCANCGAIETPTWRKAWSQDLQGVPGYHEYSDAPGHVTAIIILARDAENIPTSYKLVKKFLGKGEKQEDFDEFILCNPCGIWMSKYKTQRPEERWESNGFVERSRGEKKKPAPRGARPKKGPAALPTSEANFPHSDFPASDANFPQTDGPQDGVSPGDTTGMQQNTATSGNSQRQRSTSAQPKKRLNAMTSDAASTALRRALQSSPARWAGTQRSPIEVEDELGSTRRLLFPSPRKDGSPKVLGEVVANVVQIATEFRSPKGAMVEIEAQNKENHPPAFDENDVDAELLALFEEEMGKGDEIDRPSTPVQKSPAPNPFKTPTRPTPSHRPITRSVSRSIRSVRSARSVKSPGQLLMFTRTPLRTPGSAPRRSPRNHDSVYESPFTATLNQLMSEANNQPSPSRHGMELDFGSLPDLPNIGHNSNVDMNFSLEDFFSTDVPMPSSPPRMFSLYEDPAANNMSVNNISWEEFGRFDSKGLQSGGQDVVIKEEPETSPQRQLAKGPTAGNGVEERSS